MRRVPVTLVLHVYETVQDDSDEGNTQFYIEENHCLDNYITAMSETIARHEHPTRPVGLCTTCARGEAFLGHIPFSAVRDLPRDPKATDERAKDHEALKEDPWGEEREP